jgi:hypothetical protein
MEVLGKDLAVIFKAMARLGVKYSYSVYEALECASDKDTADRLFSLLSNASFAPSPAVSNLSCRSRECGGSAPSLAADSVTISFSDLEVLGKAIVAAGDGVEEGNTIYDTILAVSGPETAQRLWNLFCVAPLPSPAAPKPG